MPDFYVYITFININYPVNKNKVYSVSVDKIVTMWYY